MKCLDDRHPDGIDHIMAVQSHRMVILMASKKWSYMAKGQSEPRAYMQNDNGDA